MEYLVENYRSTPPIVAFFNTFIQRVQPPKPQIVAQRPANGVPVLGMFRGNVNALADDLTSFLRDVFRGPGRLINVGGQPVTIIRDPNGGNFGDAVLLSHSVNEFAAQFGNNPPGERLPRLLRTRLAQLQPPVEIFNPRGRLLRDIPVVQQLLGTILNCIDGNGALQGTLRLRAEPQRYFALWCQEAAQNLEDDLAPFCQIGPLRQTRTGLQRSFDDLIRLYYVAYSRPECVLMLVGVDPCLRYQATIRHVVLGWRGDGTWSWRTPVAGRAPALVNNHPLLLI